MSGNEPSSPLRIFLVEDDEHDRLALQRGAKDADVAAQITLCGRAEEALKRLRDNSEAFDLVVVDHRLPGMSGLELCKTLLAEEVPLPLVILTGQGSEALAVEALKAGVEDYIVKASGEDYLDLLPVVLLEAVRKYHDRLGRKHAEEALRASEESFQAIVNKSSDGILIVDRQGVLQYMNPTAERLFGRSAKDMVGSMVGFPVVAGEVIELDVIREHGEIGIAEMRVADTVWNARPAYLACLRDVTAYKRALEELDRTRRREMEVKDQFISHVSHELRSPLAAVYEFVTILLDGLAGEVASQQREHLETILRNVIQLKTMIDDLLDVTRAQTGKLSVQPRYLPLAEHVDAAIGACGGTASAKGIIRSAELPDDLPPVYADGQRVQQILTNLLNNAVKFTPENGSITVEAGIHEEDPDFLCVSVSDTGCGMNSEDCERIFEQMYQGKHNGETARKGLGLGLFICRELVCQHGGQIWVESRLNQGSTFSFTLPVFSLARRLGPILTEENLRGGSVALITADVSSAEDRSLGRLQEAALEETWDILDRCIIRAMDVVLPRMARRKTQEAFHVAACTDTAGAEALVGRIRQQLESCEALKAAGLAVTVFSAMMDLAPPPNDATSEEIAKDIASKIEDLVMAPA